MISILAITGCATSTKYKMAASRTAPVQFRIAHADERLEALIHTVIVIDGPGSWKRKALWDEYLVSIQNTSDSPITIHRAEAVDYVDQTIQPGVDPWELEKTSQKNWEHYGEMGLDLAMGTLYAGSIGVLAGFEYYFGSAALGSAALVVLPVIVGGTVVGVQVANNRNRKAVEREFNRRRLVLPFTVQPGDRISGSLFFPQTPGPQSITFTGASTDGEYVLQFDLTETPLVGLHLSDNTRRSCDAD